MLKSTKIINCTCLKISCTDLKIKGTCLKITFIAMATFVALTLNPMVAADHRGIVEEITKGITEATTETIPKTITDSMLHQAQSKYDETAEVEKLKSASPMILVYYASTDNEALLLDYQADIRAIYDVNSDYIWSTQPQVRMQFNSHFYRELENGTEQPLPWHKPVSTRASIHY